MEINRRKESRTSSKDEDKKYINISELRDVLNRGYLVCGFSSSSQNFCVISKDRLLKELSEELKKKCSKKETVHFLEDRVEEALMLFESDYENQYDLKKISRKIGLSSYYFCRIFSNYFGISPMKYLKLLRVNKVVLSLLNEHNPSISNICYSFGYNDISTFSTAFKNQIGMSPTSFRSMFLNSSQFLGNEMTKSA